MISKRVNTFETNSSSTHSYAIAKEDDEYKEVENIFKEILEDLPTCYDLEDLANILLKLHVAQTIIVDGTEIPY